MNVSVYIRSDLQQEDKKREEGTRVILFKKIKLASILV